MKRLITFFTALALCLGSAQAETTFGAKFLGGISNVTLDGDAVGPKFSFELGGSANFKLSRKVSLRPELLYVQNGAKSDDMEYEGYNFGTFDLKFQYLEIPVLLHIDIADDANIYIGPYLGISLDSKLSFAGEDASDVIDRLDAGAIVGLEYFVTRNISLEARYKYGIVDIDGGKTHNLGLKAGINYYFK